MALIKCKSCGRKTEQGLFCEKCGAELLLDADDATAVEQNLSPSISEESFDEMESLDRDPTIDLLPPVKSTPKTDNGSCSYLNVEHDQSRVFLVGQTMNFRFSLTPLVDGLRDVFVAVVFEGRGQKVEVKRLGWIPCQGERRELKNINFAAPEAGSLGFSFYFGFTKDEVEYVFEADGEHKVWPSHARVQDVVRNVEINIKNSGNANDFDLQGLAGQLMPNERVGDVIDRLHRMPPLWSNLILYRSSWRPPRVRRHEAQNLSPVSLMNVAPFSACVKKLTLRINDRQIHLISGDTINFGKNRHNDVVTRLFENGKATGMLNSKISRYHCVLERQKKHCYIVDRGDYPNEGSRPSAFGVFIDNQRIPTHGRYQLEAKKNCRVTLAGSDPQLPGVFCLELEPWSCDAAMRRRCGRDCKMHKFASLVMRRCDHVPETYIALWECFLLGEADPDFDGIVVWREENGFGYATADADGWLKPGITIQTPQCEIHVEEWGQEGMMK